MRNLILFITILFSGLASSQTFDFTCEQEIVAPEGWVEDSASSIEYYSNDCSDAVYYDGNDIWLVELDGDVIDEEFYSLQSALDYASDNSECESVIRYVVENRHETIDRVVFNISTYEFIGNVRQPEDNPLRLSFSTFIASKTQGSFTLDWGGFEYRVVRIPNGKYQIRTIQGEDLTTPGFVADAIDSAVVVEYILNNY